MSLTTRLVPALALTALFAVGCGGGSGGSSDVSAKAEHALVPYVEAVRQAAASHNHAQVKQAVRALKHEVQVEQDGISASRQADIDNAADAVLNDVTPSPSASPTNTPTQSQTPTQTPTTPPATVTITPTHTVTAPPSSPGLPTPTDTGSSDDSGDGNS